MKGGCQGFRGGGGGGEDQSKGRRDGGGEERGGGQAFRGGWGVRTRAREWGGGGRRGSPLLAQKLFGFSYISLRSSYFFLSSFDISSLCLFLWSHPLFIFSRRPFVRSVPPFRFYFVFSRMYVLVFVLYIFYLCVFFCLF